MYVAKNQINKRPAAGNKRNKIYEREERLREAAKKPKDNYEKNLMEGKHLEQYRSGRISNQLRRKRGSLRVNQCRIGVETYL
jgi:hypothetical protein